MDLAGTGVWSASLRYGDRGQAADAAAELETLGYTAAWVPDVGGDLFDAVSALLAATSRLVVATGILNIWMHEASETAAAHAALTAAHPGRLLLGLGVSHAPLIDAAAPGRYRKPLEVMRTYLDQLDSAHSEGAQPPVPRDDRVLAALGPAMLALARDRTGGVHPYLVTPEHSRRAREVLGPERLLAPEQAVVLERDPEVARGVARAHLAVYLTLPNYANNWRRLGFTEEDVVDGASDRLVDALVAWGDEAAIQRRVQEHRDAGADHVCVQVLTARPEPFPMEEWRTLAAVLV
jgi:probable F420-dependent oxidoreductase